MGNYDCPLCEHPFKSRVALEKHLNRVKMCIETLTDEQKRLLDEVVKKFNIKLDSKYDCDGCDYIAKNKDNLIKHQKAGVCQKYRKDETPTSDRTLLKDLITETIKEDMVHRNIDERLDQLSRRISTFETRQSTTANSYIVYIDSSDSLIKKLITQMGLKQAIEFVRTSALTLDPSSDSRLLDRAYMVDDYGDRISRPPVQYTNTTDIDVEYMSQLSGKKVRSLTSFMDMLAELLIDCYSQTLSLISELINKGKSDLSLDATEIAIWSKHQRNLMDNKYKKKLAKRITLMGPKRK